jgi:phosphoglycolate phosphatase-like HAD superfamily hydrolase
VLLCNLEGTLIDSSDDLTCALNAAFAEHGLRALSREQVEPLIGQGAPALIVARKGSKARVGLFPAPSLLFGLEPGFVVANERLDPRYVAQDTEPLLLVE